jgi:hypothetical protein
MLLVRKETVEVEEGSSFHVVPFPTTRMSEYRCRWRQRAVVHG